MIIYRSDKWEIKIHAILLNGLFKKIEPILWFNQGAFCIIPKEIVQNAVDSLKIWEKLSSKNTYPTLYITWDQGIPVDPKVGYALLGE